MSSIVHMWPRRHGVLALALAACAFGQPGAAGQASDAFRISVTIQPPAGSCTTQVLADGKTQVDCRPREAAPLTPRLPDVRVKLAGAVVEVGEESYQAWGEYSSRVVTARDFEYVEMTVTW
jgi:hypothetical protein